MLSTIVALTTITFVTKIAHKTITTTIKHGSSNNNSPGRINVPRVDTKDVVKSVESMATVPNIVLISNSQGAHSIRNRYHKKLNPLSWHPRANMVMAQPYNALNWILNSGAMHNLTSDLNNLALHQQY